MPPQQTTADLINAATLKARQHHAQYDPSHDFAHVNRVRLTALSLARVTNSSIDLLVVELAALFHDLIDAKYLATGAQVITARECLTEFWAGWENHVIDEERKRLVEKIVENVSYSKEVKRIKAGGNTEWHATCLELHCVQDADKLDAIGAFGILRCAAYSGATGTLLHDSQLEISMDGGEERALQIPASSAMQHFDDKLFKLQAMMKTESGKQLAQQRSECMRIFTNQIEKEWQEIINEA